MLCGHLLAVFRGSNAGVWCHAVALPVVCYHLTTRDLDRLQRGGVVTLQPHAPEEWEREEIARENGEEVTA